MGTGICLFLTGKLGLVFLGMGNINFKMGLGYINCKKM